VKSTVVFTHSALFSHRIHGSAKFTFFLSHASTYSLLSMQPKPGIILPVTFSPHSFHVQTIPWFDFSAWLIESFAVSSNFSCFNQIILVIFKMRAKHLLHLPITTYWVEATR